MCSEEQGVSVVFADVTGVFNTWRVSQGDAVYKGTALCTFHSGHKLLTVKAPSAGTLTHLDSTLHKGATLTNGQLLARVRENVCEHTVVMKDMCAHCGKDLRHKMGLPGERSEVTQAHVAMIHSVPELHVAPDVALSHGSADTANLLQQRKLVLLVDLDQTILHTTNEPVANDIEDVFHYQLHGAQSPWYHTRLRPNTREFLSRISKKYELHICTFGQRVYAHTIAKYIDPDTSIFGARILSRDECFDQQLKTANLKALFPCGDEMVVIIDDRTDVWQHAPNVVHVKPYRYFENTADINAPELNAQQKDTDLAKMEQEVIEQQSHSEARDSKTIVKEDTDDYLYHLEDILDRLHATYYKMYDQAAKEANKGDTFKKPDMKVLVPYVQSKVLQSVRIVLSGIIPTNVRLHESPLYNLVRTFGGDVQPDLVLPDKIMTCCPFQLLYCADGAEGVSTHVVAAKWGTHKVHSALKHANIHVVTPHWLWSCFHRWEKVEEGLFRLTKDTAIDPLDINRSADMSVKTHSSSSKVHHRAEQPSSSTQHEMPKHTILDHLSQTEVQSMSAEVDDLLGDCSDEDEDENGSDQSAHSEHSHTEYTDHNQQPSTSSCSTATKRKAPDTALDGHSAQSSCLHHTEDSEEAGCPSKLFRGEDRDSGSSSSRSYREGSSEDDEQIDALQGLMQLQDNDSDDSLKH